MPLTRDQGPYVNNVRWELTSSLSYGDTFLELESGINGYNIIRQALQEDNHYVMFTITNLAESQHEIIKAVSMEFEPWMEIERGEEDLGYAYDWFAGDIVEMRMTANMHQRQRDIVDRMLLTPDGKILTDENERVLLGPELTF